MIYLHVRALAGNDAWKPDKPICLFKFLIHVKRTLQKEIKPLNSYIFQLHIHMNEKRQGIFIIYASKPAKNALSLLFTDQMAMRILEQSSAWDLKVSADVHPIAV